MFVPTLLGVDLAAFSVAASVHERFGIPSHAFGRYRCGISYYSSFVKTHTVAHLLEPSVAKDVLVAFAKSQKKPCILIPTTDWYMDLAVKLRGALSPYYKLAIPDAGLYAEISDKERFLGILSAYGIDHPKTTSFFIGDKPEWNIFPCVLKPTSSTEAQKRCFDGQKKVYIIRDVNELSATLAMLGEHHRGMKYLLQEYIRAEHSYVLSVFCQRAFGTRRAALAEVLVEELGDRARGNYSALMVRELNGISRQLIAMCDAIGYDGIANFDILEAGGRYYVLEMNPRVGRSSDYLRAAGHSVADFLYESQISTSPYPEGFSSVPIYWRCISDAEVLRLQTKERADEIREKIREGFAFSPYEYGRSLLHPIEMLYRIVHQRRRTRAVATEGR